MSGYDGRPDNFPSIWSTLVVIVGVAAILISIYGFGLHAGIAAGHRDLRCGLGTIAAARPAPQHGQECLPLEVR